jgi:acyl-coenzyme A synthetase/AMP-(fatty) acid ligase
VIERFLEVAQRLRREQAICGGQECWSFGELADRVCAYGEGIGRSRKRPVIYSVLRPGLDQIALLMASMSVPTIYVPIDASISDAEMRERCALLPPDALVCDEDRVEDWEHRRSTVLPEYCRVFCRGIQSAQRVWRSGGDRAPGFAALLGQLREFHAQVQRRAARPSLFSRQLPRCAAPKRFVL